MFLICIQFIPAAECSIVQQFVRFEMFLKNQVETRFCHINRSSKNRLVEIKNSLELPQEALPECTDEDLWVRKQNEKYKYYKDPNKTDRASKVFGYDKYENPENAAMTHQAEQGVGIVKHFPAMAVRCRYCSVQPICSQSASMLMEGRLDL